jgi:HlyD family secretion protein
MLLFVWRVNILMKNHVFKRVILIISVSALFIACPGRKIRQAAYEFTTIRRGDIERTVSSSGTINPVATVKVLPRMSGKVEKIYVDYNDIISKGQILAELNTDVLRLQRDQQSASVQKARANYELQLINYNNQKALAEKNLISEYELKSSKTSLDNQAADLAVAEANLKKIETEINQYAYITSPIDGIVLDRRINVGDTVVDSSSNNSTSIFTLAENLREMQIEASVGELDVASIIKGQQVRFTMESFPGRNFLGLVETLRMVPVVSNNVVSYTVIINVENHDGSLLPGMTCAVDFIVERTENAVVVSNAALRYQPSTLSTEQISDMVFYAGLALMNDEQKAAAIEARNQEKAAQTSGSGSNNTGLSGLMMGPQPNNRMLSGGTRGQQQNQQRQPRQRENIVMRNLWFMGNDGKIEVMRVRTGISNGTLTELIPMNRSRAEQDESLLEGMQVILREKI